MKKNIFSIFRGIVIIVIVIIIIIPIPIPLLDFEMTNLPIEVHSHTDFLQEAQRFPKEEDNLQDNLELRNGGNKIIMCVDAVNHVEVWLERP